VSLRRRPWLVALVVPTVAAVLVAGAAARIVTRPDPPAPQESLRLDRACRLVLAYREAEVGPALLMAREDLRGVVHGLPVDGTPAQAAVRAYADATLGPPTAGPARYLEGADVACRRRGVPLYAW
jgi:hypothetical protein